MKKKEEPIGMLQVIEVNVEQISQNFRNGRSFIQGSPSLIWSGIYEHRGVEKHQLMETPNIPFLQELRLGYGMEWKLRGHKESRGRII